MVNRIMTKMNSKINRIRATKITSKKNSPRLISPKNF